MNTTKKREIKSETIGAKVTPTLRKKLEAIAEKEDRNISYIINRILENNFKISA